MKTEPISRLIDGLTGSIDRFDPIFETLDASKHVVQFYLFLIFMNLYKKLQISMRNKFLSLF